MTRTSCGFGGGKVILLGEHAVVHGTSAIAAGLARGVTSVALRADRDALTIAPWGRTIGPDETRNDPLARAFSAVLSAYVDRPPLQVEVNVGLPPGAGLGCSAAIAVSIVDAIDRTLGVERTRVGVGEQALRWERVFHGTPSGIDNAVAALGGLIRFERGHGAARLATPTPLHLVVAQSGERSETKDMVAQVARRVQSEPRQTREWFSEVDALVVRAEIAIEQADTIGLGRCLDRNHEVLRALGLSTPRIEALCQTAKAAGALGAKVTGAGGGGCIVALGENAAHAEGIRDALGAVAFVEEVRSAA
jgi:mevalonate kinase